MTELINVDATLAFESKIEHYTEQLRAAVPRILGEKYVEDLFDDLAPKWSADDDEYLFDRDAFEAAVAGVAGELVGAWNRDLARIAGSA